MKVLGCELGNIRTMFLLESSTIGFIGGLIGLGISLIASFVLNNLSTLGQGLDLSGLMGGGYYMGGGGGTISIIPPWLMLGSAGFRHAGGPGGRHPARKQGGQDQRPGSYTPRIKKASRTVSVRDFYIQRFFNNKLDFSTAGSHN